jgi:hypothetical protein
MADIVTNLLTYQQYLDLTEQTATDVTETQISILAMQPLVTHKLTCIGISDITTLSAETLKVLQSWTLLYITNRLTNHVEIKTNAVGDSVLREINDGFIKEVYEPNTTKAISAVNAQTHLDDLWLLFYTLAVPASSSTATANGLGVAKRVKATVCFVGSQSTK